MKANQIIFRCILLLCSTSLFAQIPVDGFYPEQNSLVVAASYDYKFFNNFYEGTELVDENPTNLGEITTSVASIYTQYGITDRISATLTLPYISLSSESGIDPVQQSNNVNGIQDLGLFLKGLITTKRYANYSRISLGGAIGVTLPLSNYEGGGILSLGSTATSLKSQAIFLYETPLRIFTEIKIGSNINTSQDFDVPSALIYNLKLGYIHRKFYTHAELAIQNSISGIDIGSSTFSPEILPETEIDCTKLFFTAYVPIIDESIGISGNYMYTLDGRNVRNEQAIGLGVVYTIN